MVGSFTMRIYARSVFLRNLHVHTRAIFLAAVLHSELQKTKQAIKRRRWSTISLPFFPPTE